MQSRSGKKRGAPVVERVLRVTLEELGRVGLAGLSLPRVAALAGINKTSLYRRWPDKAALVTAALALAVPQVPAPRPGRGLAAELRGLAVELGRFLASPAGLGAVRTLFADGAHPEGLAVLALLRARGAGGAPPELLAGAVARRELRAAVGRELLVFALAGAVLHRVFMERRPVDLAWAARLARLLCQGAQARAPRTRRSPRQPVTRRRAP